MTDTGAFSSISSAEHRRKKLLEQLLKYAAQGASGTAVASASVPTGCSSGAIPAGSAGNSANASNPVDSVNLSSAASNGTSGAPDNSPAGGQIESTGSSSSSPTVNGGNVNGGNQTSPPVTSADIQNTRQQLQQMIDSGNQTLNNVNTVPQQSSTENPTAGANDAFKNSLNNLLQKGRNISDSEANQQAADHQKWLSDQVEQAKNNGGFPTNANDYNNTNSDGQPLEQAPEASPQISGGDAGGPGAGMGPNGPGGGAPPPGP